jgi:hypothetical protein
MLTRDRPEMAKRAVRCFREQTYKSRILVIWESGENPVCLNNFVEDRWVAIWTRQYCQKGSIGALRNAAAKWVCEGPTPIPHIFIHWDDDDWSHPNRITEQVALLQASGKECVGYKDLLFWRECTRCQGGRGNILPYCPKCLLPYEPNRATPVGEAWLWKQVGKAIPGTSLCYWRKTWEQRPFPDLPKNNASEGEDTGWLRGVDSLGVTSIGGSSEVYPDRADGMFQPRLIASIHGGNTMHYGADLLSGSTSWTRIPQFDDLCRERMAL